jgi:hypothetical protein
VKAIVSFMNLSRPESLSQSIAGGSVGKSGGSLRHRDCEKPAGEQRQRRRIAVPRSGETMPTTPTAIVNRATSNTAILMFSRHLHVASLSRRRQEQYHMLVLLRVVRFAIPLLVFYVVWRTIASAADGSQTPGLFWQVVPVVLVGGAIAMLVMWLEKRFRSKH